MPAESAYVDTSVLGAYRCPEPLSRSAEIALLRLFGQHVADGYYRRLSLSAEHFLLARDLIVAMASALGTLDALHLSVALSAGLPLLTADRDFARAARRHVTNVNVVKQVSAGCGRTTGTRHTCRHRTRRH